MITVRPCHRKSKMNSFKSWETTERKIYRIEFEKPIIWRLYQTGRRNISYADQMSFICRYVVVKDKEVEVQESFLDFISELGKTTYIKKMILDQLEKEKLDFKTCRGTGCNNTAIVARVHGGVQGLLRNINGKANFVPCSNHCLNLCSVHASAVNANAITFFGVIERLYIFLLFQSPVGIFIFACEGHAWSIW